MAWQNEMTVIVRHLVNDLNSSDYTFTDDRLEEAILVSSPDAEVLTALDNLVQNVLAHTPEGTGFSVSVLCGDRGYTKHLRECGLTVITIPFAREISPIVDIHCIWSLRAALKKGKYAIVHSHNPKGTLLGPVSAKWAGSSVVVHTVHGFLFNEHSRGLYLLAALAAGVRMARGRY